MKERNEMKEKENTAESLRNIFKTFIIFQNGFPSGINSHAREDGIDRKGIVTEVVVGEGYNISFFGFHVALGWHCEHHTAWSNNKS